VAKDITVRVDKPAQIILIESEELNEAMGVTISIAVTPKEVDDLIHNLQEAKQQLR